jgi:hypothetical protein
MELMICLSKGDSGGFTTTVSFTYFFSTDIFYNFDPMELFDFSENSDLREWTIVNDEVMGGRSRSSLVVDANGNGLFKGSVSLENSGGFCSVRYSSGKIPVKGYEKIAFRVKGDGKRYQVRIRAKKGDYFSYIAYFETTGEWQTIEVLLREMYPSFRGRRLDQPNFSSNSIEEIAFLIGNKKAETFRLHIGKIMLK